MIIRTIDSKLMTKMFIQGALELTREKELINALNVFPVPDGDTGTNMSMTVNAAVEGLRNQELSSVDQVAKSVSKGSLMGARGNSGVILSQIFRGFAKGCEGKEQINVFDFASALKSASDTSYKAVMKPVEGTILTVVRNASERALELQEEDMPVHDFLRSVIERANDALDKTPDYLPVLKQAGVVDAGGRGFISILNGFYNAIIGKEIEDIEKEVEVKHVHEKSFEKADINFRYCTEFIIDNTRETNTVKLKEDIQALGDSFVFVQDENLIKVHIHTNNPGVALETAIKYGDLMNIKIDNMVLQHENTLVADYNKGPAKEYGFIAVSSGEGLDEIFRNLSVDEIISGGQTMNPSTEDFMEAIDRINAKAIYIFPNNSNIILAANQAKELTNKEVYVIPSKTVLQGISSLISFNETQGHEENSKSMTEALTAVDSISITYAVRDTQLDGREIKTGDYLSILNNKIASAGTDLKAVIKESIEIVERDIDLVTVYYGKDVKEEDASLVVSHFEEMTSADVEMHYGGQPVYYYLISLE